MLRMEESRIVLIIHGFDEWKSFFPLCYLQLTLIALTVQDTRDVLLEHE